MRPPFVRAVLVCNIFVGQFWSAALADEGRLTLPQSVGDNVQIVAQNAVDAEPSDIVQVFVGAPDTCCAGKSPMAGRYTLEGSVITFDPAFDFVEGQSYTVMTRNALTGFMIQPANDVPSTEVVAIYPSGNAIPENTLRFYIHFATPMQPHISRDFIKLVDADGIVDPEAFMAFEQELWSEDRRRLTLLMDPGRIKRGVAQNLTLGPALIEGKSYAIVIEEGWRGANGTQAAPRFENRFTVSGPLRDLPETEFWQIVSPQMSTRDPIVITFDRPFDHQLAQSAITVRDTSGQVIPGAISIADHETTWRFEPQAAWSAQEVQIVVDARLEDVAGNNFRDLLDHAVGTDVRNLDTITVSLALKPL